MARWRFKFWQKNRPRVALVRLHGVISPAGSPLRRGLNLEAVAPMLKKAFRMKGAEAVVLSVNSPGGSPVQSALIGTRIRQLARKHDRPVLAFCEDAAASGGYWLAASADEIYAHASSIIGSIGVISAGFGFPDALAKIGVERRVYTAGESKSILDPFQPEKPEDVARLKALQEDIHRQFIDWVQQRRGSRLAQDGPPLFDGSFWTGRQAAELGLVDKLGAMHSILEEKFGAELDIVSVSPRKRFGLPGMAAEMRADAAGLAAESLLASAEQRFWWARLGL